VLAQLFEQAPTFMALLRGPEHRVEVANPSFMALIGRREILGRTLAEALPEASVQGHLALLDKVFSSGEAFIANGAKFDVQPAPGGPVVERYVDLVYQPLKSASGDVGGIFVHGADVTARVRSEATLRETEARFMADSTERKFVEARFRLERERLDLALDAGQMGAYDLNFALGTIWWSPETYRLFGVAPEQFVPTPQSVLALIHPDDQETFIRLRRKAIDEHRPFVHELRLQRPDGSTIWIAHRGRAEYDGKGKPSRNFGVIMDITERKQVENLLRDADRNKDKFIAMLAHELRNPLAPIRNAVTILRRSSPADATTTWCHQVIDRQVNQMARLLDDLLDVSRLSRGQLQLRLEPITVADVVDQAIEIAQPSIYAGKHAFSALLLSEPLHVRGDATRLAQVLSNVLINAAKYTPPQGRIVLKVEQEVDHALIRVSDNGIGIAAQHLSSIFEMFVRVETDDSRSPGGQGIGLSLARSLLDLHGGTIAAFSDGPGKGTEFQIRLPLARSPAPLAAADAGSPAAEPGKPRYRVLVADDLRDSADTLARLLRRVGHTVEVAYDGEQALGLAEAFRPDIAILDLGMPKIDGYEACRRIRTSPWGSLVTLIAQTGWGQTQDLRRTREAGFDHHAVKPIELRALLAMFPAAR